MSLQTVKKQLRELPFLEMEALASQLEALIEDTPLQSHHIARALASLPTETTDKLEQDNRMFIQFFNRKRVIQIVPERHLGAWTITMEGGPSVVNKNLRDGVMEFLDSLATPWRER